MENLKYAPPPYKLGGISGRMIEPVFKPYYGDGFIADVDTLANAKFIVTACNQHLTLKEALINCQLEFEKLCKEHGTYYGRKGLQLTSEALHKIKLMEI